MGPNNKLARAAAREAQGHIAKALLILGGADDGVAADHLEAARGFLQNALNASRWVDDEGQSHTL